MTLVVSMRIFFLINSHVKVSSLKDLLIVTERAMSRSLNAISLYMHVACQFVDRTALQTAQSAGYATVNFIEKGGRLTEICLLRDHASTENQTTCLERKLVTLEVEFQCGTFFFCYHLFPSVRVNLGRLVSVR